ncbi:MAG: hypothetical protein CMQ43_03475 [Gammaproteobacteria bacterium]|nr:hypothetical protein [Porticoccaceae bacterium]MBK79962.1 hypothetical protein [Gammaproteobacteria bacterium]|tara:strand:- start:14645 stop:15391 length:747 start_codon:yes stop_codon:yes gene_type:complete
MKSSATLRRLCDCTPAEKTLYTSYLLVVGLGYLMAMVYLYTSHAGHDQRPGVSLEDVAANYYGNRSGTRLEAAIRGPMAGYISAEDRTEVVAWLKSGASRADYQVSVEPILERSCTGCHNPRSGLQVPDLTSYAAVQQVAEVDLGESLHTLMKLSHIHLFGIGLLLFTVGMIFRLAEMRGWIKVSLIALPFAAMLADILAWFLTKQDPVYATVVVIAGGLLGLSLTLQILLSLWQLWVPPRGAPREAE